MSGRLGTVADCILSEQWGLARRLCGHGVGAGAVWCGGGSGCGDGSEGAALGARVDEGACGEGLSGMRAQYTSV